MEGDNQLFTAIKGTLKRPSWVIFIFLFTALMLWSFQTTKISVFFSPKLSLSDSGHGPESCSGFFREVPGRKVIKSIIDFGGVGDGMTSNTVAFTAAVGFMSQFTGRGGSQLNVPKGRWLTGCFNLTSDFTLFLEYGAVILGHQDPKEWPIIEPLPSYGRGRERLGWRHMSLIHGNNLSNVVITDTNVCLS